MLMIFRFHGRRSKLGAPRNRRSRVHPRPRYVTPIREEDHMNDMVDVMIPVEADVARALQSPARREAAGRVLSGLLTGGRLRDVLAEAIADINQEARANGLTDEEIDAELAAWRSERRG